MNLYRLLLFFHVTGVILWLGVGVVMQVLTERAAAGPELDRARALGAVAQGFGPVYFGVVTFVVLTTGVWLVFEGGWGFDRVFVIGGLGGFVASAIGGGILLTPVSKRVTANLTAGSPNETELRADLLRLRALGRADMAIMLVVVFLMTVKPGA